MLPRQSSGLEKQDASALLIAAEGNAAREGAVFGALAEGEVVGAGEALPPSDCISTTTTTAAAVTTASAARAQIRFMRVAMAPTSGRQYARATGEAALSRSMPPGAESAAA